MTKLDIKKKNKESSLLNTAFEFFTTKGFSKTSITDIAQKAGVGKGTFYLYFKDKYDIRNRLITKKSEQVLMKAVHDLVEHNGELSFNEKFIFIVNNIIDQLDENRSLLSFISKNLSWGVFTTALASTNLEPELNFRDAYYKLLEEHEGTITDPEMMLFMIVELVSSTCYSAILYEQPCSLAELKPQLYKTIISIIGQFTAKE